MVYVRKTTTRARRPKARFARAATAKPTTRRNRNNITALAKQVSSIQRQVRARTVTGRFNKHFSRATQEFYEAITLCAPQIYNPVFGLADTFDQRNRWKSVKFNIDIDVQQKNATFNTYTMFIVSLKSAPANTVLQECGEDLMSGTNLTGMVSGQHYEVLSGKALMNLKLFNLHYVKRFTLGVKETIDGQAITTKNVSDTHKRIYCKIPWRHLIRTGDQPANFAGPGGVPVEAIQDTSKLWIILFNDVTALQEPTNFDANCMWTVTTV